MPDAVENSMVGLQVRNKLLPVFLGKVLPVFSLIVITILYSRKLTYTDYGLFQTVWIYANIIGVVISFGLSSMILSNNFRHFTSFVTQHKRRILTLYSIGWIVTFVIFYFTANRFSATTKILMTGFVILQNVSTFADTLFIKKNQLRVYLLINVSFTVLFFLIHLYFYFEPFVLDRLILSIIILYAVKAGCLVFLKKDHSLYDDNKIERSFGSNWFFIGINEMTGIIARWIDKLFLLYLLSPAAFAVFFNGAIEIPLFAILVSTMETVMLNNIAANITNKENAVRTFRESFKILSLVAFPLFFFLLAMHAELFQILFNNRYNASIPVFLVSIFIIPVRISHYGVLLQCYGQAHKIFIGSLMDIAFSLLLMFILFPLSGTPGVAVAIVISTYLQAFFYLWQSSKTMSAKITQLVPFVFLARLFGALGFVYGLLYFAKTLLNVGSSVVLVFCITGCLIATGLFYYWRHHKQKIWAI